jgi:quercetin dioxygenase-like cupin family protein
MDRKSKIAAGLAITLTSTAFALSFQHTVTGRIDSFAFPSGSGPGYIQIQSLILKPGDSTGWHHHDGPAWMILQKGSGVVESEASGVSLPERVGTAFAESGGNVHKVDNFGPGEATIWWATVYPEGSTPIVPDDGPPPCQQ